MIIYDDNNGCVDSVDYIYPVYLMAVGKSIFDWKMQMQKICFCCNSTTWLVGILGRVGSVTLFWFGLKTASLWQLLSNWTKERSEILSSLLLHIFTHLLHIFTHLLQTDIATHFSGGDSIFRIMANTCSKCVIKPQFWKYPKWT